MLPQVILLNRVIIAMFVMINAISPRPLVPQRLVVTATIRKLATRIAAFADIVVIVFFDNMSAGRYFIEKV